MFTIHHNGMITLWLNTRIWLSLFHISEWDMRTRLLSSTFQIEPEHVKQDLTHKAIDAMDLGMRAT